MLLSFYYSNVLAEEPDFSLLNSGEPDSSLLNSSDNGSIVPNDARFLEKPMVPERDNDRVTLDFQEIDIKDLFKTFSEFTGFNIIVSDKVMGSVSVHLHQVPWQEALDIVLKMKGLSQRKIGNIILIGLADEMMAQDQMALQSAQQTNDSSPLIMIPVQIHYAKAADIAALLKSDKNTLLSNRGMISVDDRTNTVLIQDTEKTLMTVQEIIGHLDVPVRQVLIESRIVFANEDFERELGINIHATAKKMGDHDLKITPLPSGVTPTESTRLARLGMSVAPLPQGIMLDLELLALEHEGLGKIIASPRLITSNQQQAYIESGEEIPYQESTSGGAAAIAFKKAVLRLEVTPQITPDDHIILDLKVNQDSRGQVTSGVPSIHTRELHTKAFVANGETVVLGGIFQENKIQNMTGVPFLCRLPLLGWLFKSKADHVQRNELFIFVTPNIIETNT